MIAIIVVLLLLGVLIGLCDSDHRPRYRKP